MFKKCNVYAPEPLIRDIFILAGKSLELKNLGPSDFSTSPSLGAVNGSGMAAVPGIVDGTFISTAREEREGLCTGRPRQLFQN